MNQHEIEFAPPETHFHHLYRNLPAWVLESSPQTRSALKNASLELPLWQGTATRLQHQVLKASSHTHWTQRNRLGSRLERLQNARDFAEALLAPALKARFDLDVDVKTTFLRLYIPQTTPWFGIKTGGARTWTVSLLDAALHNFQQSETAANAYEPASTFITEPSATGQFDTLAQVSRKITIQAFTRLCRELDIGGQYNAYLKDNLGVTNRVVAAVLKPNVMNANKAALRSALHLALTCKDIDSDAFNAIDRILVGRANKLWNGHPLHCHDLTMMSSSLTGIIIFGAKSDRATKPTSIIAYIPDDPEHPLKQYPDTVAFMTELTRKLRSPAYQTFFSRFVDHQERGHFFADLNSRLQTVTWHQHTPGDPLPSWRETPIDKPNLGFSMTPFRAGLWNHLYQRQLNKIINDASTIAISTARADQTARWALWDAFSKVASTILEIATFVALPFVPFLGELMLAYMAYQLLYETFEGIVDWAQGLKTEAFEHLIGVVESAVQLGLFAAGGKLAVGELKPLLPPATLAFFERLTPVKPYAGKTRYWIPDLTPYEYPARLPTDAKPNLLGLYQHQGKTLLPIEDKIYTVSADNIMGAFQIEHPTRADAYRPLLRHNHHGAWQTELEQPMSWDRETVMRRIGYSVDSLSSAEREQVLRISGYNDNELRQMHVDNLAPPSLLTDCVKRFKINRDIQTFIDQISSEQPAQYTKADPAIQLELLSRYDAWPVDEALPELKNQSSAFRQQTASIALQYRKSLFELRYQALEKTDIREIQHLKDDVQGLPTDIALELTNNATGTELRELNRGQVPRRLKDAAQKAMEAVRTARAYEGLYFQSLETTDTDRLALHSLSLLPNWPQGLRLEVRDHAPDGLLRDSVGNADAANGKTLVRSEQGDYRAQGDNEQASDFYTALLHVLPQAERNALNIPEGNGTQLRQFIAEHTLSQPKLRTLLAKNPHRKPFYDPTTMRLPGGIEGYHRINAPTPTLNERVREVYPSLPEEGLQAFVQQLQQHPEGARIELSRVSRELSQLHQDLHTWIDNAPTVNPLTGEALSELELRAEHNNRRLLAQEIQRSWRRQTDRDFDVPDGRAGYVLKYPEPILGELPTLTADFSHVPSLSLEGSHSTHGVAEFLQHFKELRCLDLKRFSLTTLPKAIATMSNLDTLVLSDCGITFNATNWSELSSLNKLIMLDLYKNRFTLSPDLDSMPDLVVLDLSRTGLKEIPPSLLRHQRLETAKLLGNQINELPAQLFESEVYAKRALVLTHNPLSDNARQMIKHHYFDTSYALGIFAPEADIDRVMSLYPDLEVEQASEFVYDLPGTLQEGRTELTRLEAELTRLRDDLSTWTADLPQRHPLTNAPFDAQQQLAEHSSRDEFKQLLERCWRRQTALDDFNEALEPTHELIISSVINGELPTLSADFSHVSSLELYSSQGVTRIGHFLESFPNLKNLILRECNLGNIPDAVFKMGPLRSLSLGDARITLTPESAIALGAMDQLDYLDLSHNPLGQTLDLRQMPDLATVLLNNSGITEIPLGLFELKSLDWADLSDNQITEIPRGFHELSVEIAENINLRNNPLNEDSLGRLVGYYQRTGVDFEVEAVLNQAEMDISDTEGSEVDE
jgi:Leucine-rich repeat (LRR) protein